MDDKEVGKYWDENAENWVKIARMGYDRCRDLINSPAFFKMPNHIHTLHQVLEGSLSNPIFTKPS